MLLFALLLVTGDERKCEKREGSFVSIGAYLNLTSLFSLSHPLICHSLASFLFLGDAIRSLV